MQFNSEFSWPTIKDSDPVATLSSIENSADPGAAMLHESLQEVDNWASEVLKATGLPSEINALQQKLASIDENSSAWYAGNSLLQVFTLRSALENGDQATAILLGFLLADFRWQGHFAENHERSTRDKQFVEEILNDASSDDLEVESYRAAISVLKKKYPHCSINALRLLLANKLNVSKQRLDELNISPA